MSSDIKDKLKLKISKLRWPVLWFTRTYWNIFWPAYWQKIIRSLDFSLRKTGGALKARHYLQRALVRSIMTFEAVNYHISGQLAFYEAWKGLSLLKTSLKPGKLQYLHKVYRLIFWCQTSTNLFRLIFSWRFPPSYYLLITLKDIS